MNKIKFNHIGGGFSHATGGHTGKSTCHGKYSKYIDWVQDGSGVANFYFQEQIPLAFSDNSNLIKYAWLNESESISSQPYHFLKNNLNQCLEVFEYIFTHDKNLVNLHPKIKYAVGGFWIKEPKIYEKSKIISMISSNKKMCGGHLKRLEWVDRIGDQVDLYGRGFKEIELKEEGLCDYMFSVAIENLCSDGYFTEKILDCFATGTIPVYLGAPNIGDYFNMDGIINLTNEFDVSEEIYHDKIDAILDNFERCKKYEIAEDYVWETYLKYEFE